ncbi:MAG: DUF1571 domain-containing protein [Candidatus Ancaeobacter aquaticus]|nr:DUF1571 domain-containing protein [Candidatus Ancaeobacter aquaticus]
MVEGKLRRQLVYLMSTLFLCGSIVLQPPAVTANDTTVENYDALEILLNMQESYNNIDGYTAVLVKGEPLTSKSKTPQKIFLKFRKPFHVYMKWIESPHNGREILYRKGEDNDNIFAKPAGFLGAILRLVKLPSDYKSGGSKYTIQDVGIGRLIEKVLHVTLEAKETNDVYLSCKGITVRNGRDVYEIERVISQENKQANKRLVLYIDKETYLPVEAYVYNGEGKLTEFCMYTDLKINPGLVDNDFNVDNKKYGFRYL